MRTAKTKVDFAHDTVLDNIHGHSWVFEYPVDLVPEVSPEDVRGAAEAVLSNWSDSVLISQERIKLFGALEKMNNVIVTDLEPNIDYIREMFIDQLGYDIPFLRIVEGNDTTLMYTMGDENDAFADIHGDLTKYEDEQDGDED